jgi:hypothetical protein
MSIEAMKLALGYMDGTLVTDHLTGYERKRFVMDALRQAIEQAEQAQSVNDGPINDGWQLSISHGHSGYGVYANMDEYPEEGAVLVLPIEQAQPVAWPEQIPYQPFQSDFENGHDAGWNACLKACKESAHGIKETK